MDVLFFMLLRFLTPIEVSMQALYLKKFGLNFYKDFIMIILIDIHSTIFLAYSLDDYFLKGRSENLAVYAG
ncbi:Uncharacterised protein [Klebsiella pneumoniae]|nr:Uncharacterised protein [Klebsiella pneumoniae]